MFDDICEAIHMELNTYDERFADGAKMTTQDLEAIDKMTHILKSIASYKMAKEYEPRDRRTRNGYYRY